MVSILGRYGSIAGMPTHLDSDHKEVGAPEVAVAVADAPAFSALPVDGDAPNTVGMSRAAAIDAKRAWRMQQMQLTGVAPPPTPRPSTAAGVVSEAGSRTFRGQVGPLQPESAADYNLQVKLAKGEANLSAPKPRITTSMAGPYAVDIS